MPDGRKCWAGCYCCSAEVSGVDWSSQAAGGNKKASSISHTGPHAGVPRPTHLHQICCTYALHLAMGNESVPKIVINGTTNFFTTAISISVVSNRNSFRVLFDKIADTYLKWWGVGVVIYLERGADLHMAQLMPLPLIVSCFSKIQIGFTFLVPAHLGSPGRRAVKQVCVFVFKKIYFYCSIRNGQPREHREPALCHLYRHTSIPYELQIVCWHQFSAWWIIVVIYFENRLIPFPDQMS